MLNIGKMKTKSYKLKIIKNVRFYGSPIEIFTVKKKYFNLFWLYEYSSSSLEDAQNYIDKFCNTMEIIRKRKLENKKLSKTQTVKCYCDE